MTDHALLKCELLHTSSNHFHSLTDSDAKKRRPTESAAQLPRRNHHQRPPFNGGRRRAKLWLRNPYFRFDHTVAVCSHIEEAQMLGKPKGGPLSIRNRIY